MSAPPQIEEWVSPLSHLANGESMASLVLAPSYPILTPSVEPRPVQEHAEIITTLPDGTAYWPTLYFRSRQGLDTPARQALSPQGETPQEAHSRLPEESSIAFGLTPDARDATSPAISQEARAISGLPGWLRPVSPLPWSGLSLVGSEHQAARGWINPEFSSSEKEPIEEDDEPPFMAHGEFLE